MAKYIRNLAEIRKEDVFRAGGKAANLGEMIYAGLPVPGGFVVLTNGYKRFVEENDLEKELEGLLSKLDEDSSEDIKKATEEIKALFSKGDIPEDIKKEIGDIYEEIGKGTVAIRSSATAEDMPGMSFAGQYSTYLNVKGNKELYKYIIKCWASLWNERAVSYRIKQNIGNKDLAHGVVVQKLINAEKSGILFTANPVNGRRDEVLINSSWGLGEAIVGGEVNPDQWVIDKKSEKVVSEEIAQKKVQTIRKELGIELVDVAKEKQAEITLNEKERRELIALAAKVEGYYNSPQDIEWAYEAGEFYLVQTRPITTLYPIPEAKKEEDDLRIYLNLYMYSQSMKEPFTPMGFDLAERIYRDVMTKYGKKNYQGDRLWWFHNLGGRGYADVTDLFRTKKSLDRLKSAKRNDKDPLTTKALIQVLERNKDIIMDKKKVGFKLISFLNFRVIKVLIEAMYKSFYGTINPEKARIKARKGEEALEQLLKQRESHKTVEEKIMLLENNIGVGLMASLDAVFYGGITLTYLNKAEKIMKKYLDDISDLNYVEKSVPHNVTTEMGMELLHIAKVLDDKGKRASAEEKEIKSFLEKYGDKNSSIELEVASITWREDPTYIIDLINSFIDNKNYNEEIDRFHSGKAEAEEAISRIKEKLEQRAGKRTAKRVEKILRNYRAMFGLRELPKFYLTKFLSICRTILIEIGELLEREGRLEDKMDVFYVTIEDIKSNKSLVEIVAKNREEYNRELKRPMPPRIITSTGESIYSVAEKAGKNSLAGVAVSPGVYEGKVKVITNLTEGNKLEKGDILVTTGTNPAWTPLFLKIGALIMETGGPISHGSVVAREYGVPAVVGVDGATTKLKDGQTVRINGETGVVELT